MNKNLYRLVFNAARGMLVAVQECAVGMGKGRHAGTRSSSGATAFAPVLWFTALTAAMMGLPVFAQTLPIQVDKSAPGARPYVNTAGNGVPVVNIGPPNRPGGTSVNNFLQYNVGPSGVVINNSGQNSQTQIAGWVQGNMQLGNNSAGTIVQQVTAPNPSQLLGMQEIAGNRATLVIANPAGITCSGCGTIGADRFTLSTGRALYGADGSLTGFDVRQGNIAIDGQGLSSPQAQVDLLSRSLVINAQVWADRLNAITGANQIDHQTLAATPQAGAGAAPLVALDASALGSMYVGAVRLIGTEKGLGFNIGGNLVAMTGDIVVDNNGDVRVLPAGRLQAQGNASVSGATIDNAGTITTHGGVTLATPGQLTNSGTVAAGTDLLAQGDSIANHGTLGAGVDANANVTGAGTANLAARTALQSDGTIVTGADANLSAPALTLNYGSVVSHGTANLSASGDIAHQNARLEGNTVQIQAGGALDNRGGAIVAGAGGGHFQATTILNQGSVITSAGALAVQTPGAVNNQGGTLAANAATTVAGSQILNQGGVIGSAQADLTVTGPLDNSGGKTLAATDMSITGGLINNTNGQISAGHSLSLDTASQALVNNAGVISANDLHASTGAFHNQGGVVQATGALAIDTHGQTYDNSQGLTVANGAMALTTGALNNPGGTVSGQEAVTLSATGVDNTGGKVVAGGPLAVTADSLVNANGQLASNADATLRIANTFDNTAGFTHAGGTLDAQAGTIVNRNTLGGTDTAPLGMEGATVKVAAARIDNTQGALRADQSLTAAAATLDNTQGQVTSGGAAQLNVGAMTNTQGLLSANQKLSVSGTSLTGDGTVQSKGDVTLKLASDFNNTGSVTANGNVTLDTTGDVTNAGTMGAGQVLDVHGRNITNTGELVGQVSNHLHADQAVYNAGLIDGGATRLDAGTTVTNVGRTYGDSVAIGAGRQILNDVNPATGQGGVIASRSGDVNLGAPDIVNREHALIYSSQDLNVGGALDANGKATGQAGTLTNASATLDVARDANISAANVSNLNNHFSTVRTDTGTQTTLTYRLNGSSDEIPADQVVFFHVNNGSWAPGTDSGFPGNDDYIFMVLPSTQYPFSQFGPPFDFSRPGPTDNRGAYLGLGSGLNSFPVCLAYYPGGTYTSSGGESGGDTTLSFDPLYIYQPGDAIWAKFGVQAPSSGSPPPQPVPCDQYAPAACQAKYDADAAAYTAWHDANQPLYDQLNAKISAFNNDFKSRQVKEWWIDSKTTQHQDEVVATTDPAKILVGRDASFNGAVTNDKSQILVGGNLSIPAPVQNLEYVATRIDTVTGTTQWTHIKSHAFSGDERVYDTYPLAPVNINVQHTLQSAVSQSNMGTIGHDGSAPANGTGLAPIASAPTLRELALPQTAGAGGRLGGDTIRVVTPALAMPRNALFTFNTQPGAHYLIETDPRFTDQRQWLSSDYMLTQLGQDPNNVLKRLGDGFYEARLVADAVMLGTGQRFVGDYTDNEQQYIGLMNAGVKYAQQFHLNVGSELSADQMAALTSDMVWLVEKTVTLPDGSTQKVLVPQVYLMARVGDLKGDGTVMSANNVSVQTNGDVINTGTISGRKLALVDAQNIQNNGGTLNGGTLVLNAQQDLNNLAGKITGGNVRAQAGRDINLDSTTATGSSKTGSSTVLAGVSSVNADNATLLAGRDVNAHGASIQTTGDLGIGAGRDVNFGTVKVAQDEHVSKDAQNNYSLSRSTEIGTQTSSGGNTTIVANRDVNATAAYVNANGALEVDAKRDININAGQSSASVHDEHSTKSGGFLSSTSTHTIDESAGTEALGSTFSGDTVTMKAGRDLTTSGSTIAATHDVNLDAGRNLTLGTAQTSSSAYSFKEEKKSGFGATGSGISYGNRDQKDTTHDNGTQQVGSLVGSTDGSVHLNAGSTLAVKGSDLIAKQDITGKGADVNIEAAQNAQHHDETHEVKSSGFTLGVQSPVLSAVQNVYNQVDAASSTSDARVTALRGVAAARGAYDMGKAMADPTDVAVSLSYGTSQSKQTLTQDSTTYTGSRVQAGGTAAFQATGVNADGNKTAGDLNIIGSDITAKNVTLQAKNNVNIESATDTDESHSTNKSSSASVGVSYGTKGFGVSASGSMARGNSDSTDATQSNSHVSGSDSVSIASGNDTNILGATVSGGKVIADVGGNLNMASRQDTGEMHAKQESMSAGVSISQGGGSASFSASRGNASGSYANVVEQSGIYAGQAGFNINVKGNTDLKGAVIASEATQDKNRLTTGTLTYSDLRNHSDYSANSFGVSAGIGYGSPTDKKTTGPTSGQNTGGINPMIPQHESGSQDGIAHAAVADGSITITDGANQKQDLAGLKRDTAGSNTTVSKGPDLKGVLDKQSDMMAAAQAAGEAVAKSVGDIASSKRDDALANAKSAHDAGDTALEQQYLADAESWGEGGSNRAALHAAGGALVAGLGGGNALAGAVGAGAASLLAPKIQDGVNTVYKNVNTGNTDLDQALANATGNIAAGLIGGAIGGGSGAAAAANVDLYNRQLTYAKPQDLKTVAAKEATKAGMTPDQMEKAMSVVLGTYYDDNGVPKAEGVTYDQYMKAQAALLSQPANSPLAKEYAQAMRGVLPQFAYGDTDGAPNLSRIPGFSLPSIGLVDGGPLSQAAIRSRVEANVAESSAARASSNFGSLNEWPPQNGFVPGTAERYTLFPGQLVDRYGSVQGTFVAEAGASYRSRALRPGSDSAPYNVYEVTRPIEVTAGPARPWFGYEGMGTQYKLDESVRNLIQRGALRKPQ